MKSIGIALAALALATTATLPVALQASEIHKRIVTGSASWYGPGFHGRRTANGERYDMHKLTAAHKSLPFGTRVKVTNARTGQSVVVRINDRGPFVGRRVIDLSRGAANAVGLIRSGVAPVQLEIIAAKAKAEDAAAKPAVVKGGSLRNRYTKTVWSPVSD